MFRDASLHGLDNMSDFNRVTLDGLADNVIAEIHQNGFQHQPGGIDQDFINFLLDMTPLRIHRQEIPMTKARRTMNDDEDSANSSSTHF